MFQTVPRSIIRSISLYTQQWYTSYRFADSLQAGSGWNSILILLASCLHTGMTYTSAVCTVKYSWWWTEELSETCRVSFQNKIEKSVHLVGFLIWNLSRCTVTWMSNFLYHKTHFSLSNTAYTHPVSYGLKALQYDVHETAAFFGRIMAIITWFVLVRRKTKFNFSFTSCPAACGDDKFSKRRFVLLMIFVVNR